MANIIKHKRSSSAGAAPSVGDIQQSELAINIADGKLYTKNSSNNIINLGVTTISGTYITPVSGSFNTIIFNDIVNDDLSQGQMGWNSTYGTVELGLESDHKLHLGQETNFRVRNETGTSIYKGQAVAVTGIHNDNIRLEIDKYVADGNLREIRFIGLLSETLDDNQSGLTTNFGYIRGTAIDSLDTRGNGSVNGAGNLYESNEPAWSQGDILFVHPTASGKLTKIEPKHSISVAIVVRVHQNEGVLLVRPTSYGHLGDNHDVDTSGATNNQYLRYDSGSDIWLPTSSGIFTKIAAGSDGAFPSSPEGLSIYSQGGIFSSGVGIFGDYSANNYVTIGNLSTDVGIFDNEDTPIAIKTANGLSFQYGNIYYDLTTGNIGINESSPDAQLEVNGDILAQEINIESATSGAILFNIEGTNGNLFSVVDSVSGSLLSVNDITGLPAFEVFSDHKIVAGRFNQNDFVVSSGGNVGIGTSSPSNKLEVAGGNVLLFPADNTKQLNLFNTNYGIKASSGLEIFTGDYIRFRKSSTEYLRIDSSGNIGIGTTTPQSSLTINTTIGTNSNINSTAGYAFGIHHSGMRITSPEDTSTNPNYPLINLLVSRPGGYQGGTASIDFDTRDRGNNFNRGIMARIAGGAAPNTGMNSLNGGLLRFDVAPTGTTVPTTRMVIDRNGYVGIGTETPNEKLEVAGDVLITGGGASIAGTTFDNGWLKVGNSSIGIAIDSNEIYASQALYIGTIDNNSNISFRHGGTERLVIYSGGNVGIGTTSTPSYKLQVNGSFGATTKSFRIDHPNRPNYTLEYGSLESPYHGVRLTGRGKVVKGVGVVLLPDYLKDLIHDDETINIQLTNLKHGKTLYVSDIDLNNSRFTVKADRAKTVGDLEFFWTFTGVRKDVPNLVVEKPKEGN